MRDFLSDKRNLFLLAIIIFLIFAMLKLSYSYKEQIASHEFWCLAAVMFELEDIVGYKEQNLLTEELLDSKIAAINTAWIIMDKSPRLSFIAYYIYENIIDPINEEDFTTYQEEYFAYMAKLAYGLKELLTANDESDNNAIRIYNYLSKEKNRINFENNYLKLK